MPRKPGPKKEQVLLRLLTEPTMKNLRALAKKRKQTVQVVIAELIEEKFSIEDNEQFVSVVRGRKTVKVPVSSLQVQEKQEIPTSSCNHPIGRRIGNGCGQCGKENVK